MDIEATVFLSPLIQGMIMSTGFAALVDCRGWCEHMFIFHYCNHQVVCSLGLSNPNFASAKG